MLTTWRFLHILIRFYLIEHMILGINWSHFFYLFPPTILTFFLQNDV